MNCGWHRGSGSPISPTGCPSIKPACSQLIDKLVVRGYVIKTRLAEDQRRVGLTITKDAARVLKEAPGPAEGLIPEALMGLPPATLESLMANLGDLIEGLQLQDHQAAEKPLADL